MSAHDLFHEGKLDEALAAQIEQVRNHPTDLSRRIFLAEILCFTGDLDRADKQLDTVGHQDPKAMPVATIFRHLIRAAQARIDCFETGRVPDLLGELQGSSRLLLQSLVHLRGGDNAQALGLSESVRGVSRVKPRSTTFATSTTSPPRFSKSSPPPASIIGSRWNAWNSSNSESLSARATSSGVPPA